MNGNYGAYQTCMADYNRRVSEYNMYHQQTTNTRAPSPPNYGTCDRTAPDGTTTRDQTCVQSLERNYQTQLQNYNTIKQQEQIAAQQRALEVARYEASREAAKAAEDANRKAQQRYQRSQFLSTAASVALIAPCSSVTNSAWACPAMAFFAMMAGKAGSQSGAHNTSAWNACNIGNSLGTSQSNCGAQPPPFNPSTFPNNTEPSLASVIDPNGNCTASPEICDEIKNNLPNGVNLKDVAKGISMFAGGKSPIKLDEKGNAIGKDGKTYSLDAMNSVDGLKSMGFSEEDAKKLLANMAKYNDDGSGLADGKSGAGGSGSGDGSGLDAAAAAAAAAGAGGTGNGDADGSSMDIGGGKRKTASAEGLARDFNGELIGVAGDDIFKMMNRRYQLKAKQDTFINNK